MSRPPAPAAPPDPTAPADPAHRVTLVAFEGMQLLDLAGPLEVFAAANQLGATPPYDLRVATPGGGAVRTSSGLAVQGQVALDDLVTGEVDDARPATQQRPARAHRCTPR